MIDGREAWDILKALAPLMDDMASHHRYSTNSRASTWDTALTLRAEIWADLGVDPFPTVGGRTCGALTLKGGRCLRSTSMGRVHCASHSSVTDVAIERAWQDAVHWPFTRTTVPPGMKANLNVPRMPVTPIPADELLEDLTSIMEQTK